MATPAVSLLIIRAWPEPGSDRPLRADVSLTADTTRGFDRRVTFSDVDDVASVVHAWLAEVAAAASRSTPPERGA